MNKFVKKFFFIINDCRKYFIGFFFSFILTILPFLFLIFKSKSIYLSKIIIICSIIQIFIHFYSFLHIDLSYKRKFNLISLLFALLIIFIFVTGSIYIINSLDINLMNL